MVKLVWLIPIVPNISLRGLIAPFKSNVWFAVGIVLISTIIIKSLVLHDITFLDVFALIIGTSTPDQPTKLSSRIQYLSWAIFGYILSQSYLASLSGVLIYEANQQIVSMEELVATGIPYGGIDRFKELFASVDSEDDSDYDELSNSDVIRTIHDNFQVFEPETYDKKLQDLISGRDKNIALVVMLNFSSRSEDFVGNKVQQLKEPLGSFPLGFAVWKGLPYLDQIDRKIMLLTEGGFVSFYERRYLYTDDDSYGDDESSDELGLAQLAPGFFLLVIGLLVGTLTLFGEILLDTFRKRRLIKERAKKIATIWLQNARRNKKKKKEMKTQMNNYKRVKIIYGWDYGPKKKI